MTAYSPIGVDDDGRVRSMSREQVAAIFNEWARRYADNPEEFMDILDSSGRPISDYGERCARYFKQISEEIIKPPKTDR